MFAEVVSQEIEHLKMELSLIVTDKNLRADGKLRKFLLKELEILNNATNYHENLKADFYEHFDFLDNLRNDLDTWGKIQLKNILQQGINEGIFSKQNVDMEILLDVFIMVSRGVEIPFFLQGKYNKLKPHFNDLLQIIIKGRS